MKNNDLLSVNPVENYEAPRIPTLDDTCGNAEMLKKLPNRWKRKAAVIACLGIMGANALTGCMGHREFDRTWRVHNGGAFSSPMYIVHMTEQEAFGIIRSQLEAAGLNFDAEPPDYTVQFSGSTISLELFDEERNVAIARVRADDRNITHFPHEWQERWHTNAVAQRFAEQTDITVGVFYNQGVTQRELEYHGQRATRDFMESQLDAQVREFIDFLRNEGIL
ncbi:MAG: DUF4136 domain-containing protein [Oscillospiraceae bacterium]|nr:DUF4136 domain-containing protein [Oscillospiraceae bacterium]